MFGLALTQENRKLHVQISFCSCFFIKPVSPDALFGTVLQAIFKKMALSYCSSYEHDIFLALLVGQVQKLDALKQSRKKTGFHDDELNFLIFITIKKIAKTIGMFFAAMLEKYLT